MNAEAKSYYFTDRLKEFDYINAKSVDEAVKALQQYEDNAKLLAGGSNLIPALRFKIFSKYPEKVISLKNVKELKYIKEESGLKIGALTTLSELLNNKTVNSKYKMLADAVRSSAPPQIRNLMTIGGDICQELYSWYIWNPNPLVKDLDPQYLATEGMNQYLSIFGGAEVGYAINVSNLAVALTALNANVVTTKKTIPIKEFYSDRRGSTGNTVLEPDEIVTEIQIPKPEKNTKQTFMKLSLRKFIDPPLVTVAAVVSLSGNTVKKCKIVLGAVAPEPWEASEAENYVEGKELTKDVAEKAAEEAVANAEPLTKNDYKVQMAKVLVKRALLSL